MSYRALDVEGLSKAFPRAGNVLTDVCFSMSSGDSLGLLGPNGTGKTTLLRCLCGSITPDSGLVSLHGEASSFHLSIDSEKSIFPRLTAEENLNYFCGLRGVSYHRKMIESAIEELDFSRYLKVQSRKLSKGSKQKIQILLLMLSKSDVILLDEPTIGLDMRSIEFLISTIKEKRECGKCFIISSHDADFFRAVCNQYLDVSTREVYRYNSSNICNLYRIEVNKESVLSSLYSSLPSESYDTINETVALIKGNALVSALQLIPESSLKSVTMKGVSIDGF